MEGNRERRHRDDSNSRRGGDRRKQAEAIDIERTIARGMKRGQEEDVNRGSVRAREIKRVIQRK